MRDVRDVRDVVEKCYVPSSDVGVGGGGGGHSLP